VLSLASKISGPVSRQKIPMSFSVRGTSYMYGQGIQEKICPDLVEQLSPVLFSITPFAAGASSLHY
jgi:hypothetical protein